MPSRGGGSGKPKRDGKPTAFAFASVTDAANAQFYTSDEVTLTGFNISIAVTVTGGSMSKNGGLFTTTAQTAVAGDRFRVRVKTVAAGSETSSSTLTAGGVAATYSVTTAASVTPVSPFTFGSVTNAFLNTEYISPEITIEGPITPVGGSITGGLYSQNGGPYTGIPFTAIDGDTFKVKRSSSSLYSTASLVALTVGAETGNFTITTMAQPTSDPYEGVNPATLALRAQLIVPWENAWPGYQEQAFASDVLVTSASALEAAVNAVSRTTLSAWHRIRLDSTQPSSAWDATAAIQGYDGSPAEGVVAIGHLYGSTWDRASAGGGILIESSNPALPVAFQKTVNIRGYRGIHFRSVNFSNIASAPTGTARDAAVCVAIQSSSTFSESGVVRFEDCGFGLAYHASGETDERYAPVAVSQTGSTYPTAQVDLVNCVWDGTQTAFKSTGIYLIKDWGSDFKRVIGDCRINLHTALIQNYSSAVPEMVNIWRRLATNRNMADNAAFSSEHTDFGQCGTSGDIGGYNIVAEFEISHAYRITGTDNVTLTFSAQPVNLSTITVGGTVFTFKTTATAGTDIQIGATLSETLTTARTVITANLPASMHRVSGSSTTIVCCFNFDEYTAPSRSTVPASNATIGTPLRVAGGTQGYYDDDSSYPFNAVRICSLMTANDGIADRVYNGTSIIDRCTGGRPKAQPPNATVLDSGFNYSEDFLPYFTSGRKTQTTLKNHTIYNSIVQRVLDFGQSPSVYRTANGVYTGSLSTLTITGCQFPDWSEGNHANEPGDVMAGTFVLDAQDRWSYTMQDDGLNTQAQFRAAMYAQFQALAGPVGITDPATWPAS